MKVKRAIGYARISSDSQIDNTSVEEQTEKIKGYCKLYNIELDKIFIDEGLSGSNIARIQYRDMMEYARDKENNINAVLVLKGDRIHRKLKNLLVMIEELEDLGIAFISITEQFDTSTAQGTLFLQMLGSFAEFERKVINERTKSGRIAKGTHGRYAGGRPPYGYNLVDGERLTVNDETAKIVKEIFTMKKDGISIDKIVKNFNSKGISINGKKWSTSKVLYILKNEIYIGKYTYCGLKEKNNIKISVEPIIRKRLWNAVHKYDKIII